MSVYVSIGRNIGSQPMVTSDWAGFINAVKATVATFAGPVVSCTKGTGYYEGREEDCCIIVGAVANPGCNLDALRTCLAHLAREYFQDAIALTIAEPEFVGPR